MVVFPQFGVGSGQYPLRRRRSQRTVKNQMADGTVWKLADSAGSVIEWELPMAGLTDAERVTLESFFTQVEGRLGTFTFLDPVDNLLARSEEFGASDWVKDPLLQLTSGIADPFGGASGTRLVNSGQISQSIQQTIAAPGWFTYCTSVYLRSDSPVAVVVQRATVQVPSSWQRVSVRDQLVNTNATMTFALQLPPGAVVEIFGFQAEAQAEVSDYKRTTTFGGVYSTTRFMDDRLVWTAEGPNNHSTELRTISRVRG